MLVNFECGLLPSKPLRLSIVVSSLMLGTPASAQDLQEADNPIEIVVEATLDRPESGVLNASKSLDREDLNRFAPISISEELSQIPGLVAFEKGGAGGGSYVSIRGGEPNFALVVINGVRVDDPLNSSGGGFDYSLIDPAIVQRVSIVSGPTSTAYGADALSGVVSIETGLDDIGNSAGVHAGVGSNGRFILGGHAGLTGRAGRIALAVGRSDSNVLQPGSTTRRLTTLLTANPNLGRFVTLNLFALYAESQSEGFPEDSGGPELAALPLLEQRDREQLALGGTLAVAIAPTITGQLRLGYSRNNFDAASPGIPSGVLNGIPTITTDSIFQRYEAVATATWQTNDWLTADIGASYTVEDGTSEGDIDFGFVIPTAFTISRAMPGLFATLTAETPSGASVSGGLRIDWPEGGAARWTPRIGAQVPIGDSDAIIFANYARGFKRPSLFALGYPLIANPNLKDERSETLDAGISYRPEDSDWEGAVTFFRSTYRNLIDFDPQLFTNVNRDRVISKGAEISLTKRIANIALRGSLTYSSTRSDDGSALRFRPDWTGNISATWQATDMLSLSLSGEFSSSFNDASIPTGAIRADGFEKLSVAADWKVSDHITLFGTIRNLTDTKYQRTIGFPEPGRNFFIGFRGGF